MRFRRSPLATGRRMLMTVDGAGFITILRVTVVSIVTPKMTLLTLVRNKLQRPDFEWGGPGLVFEPCVFRPGHFWGKTPGLKSETWATRPPLVCHPGRSAAL